MGDGVRERPGIPYIGRLRPRRACPGREAHRETRRDGRGRCARGKREVGDDRWARPVSVAGGDGEARAACAGRARLLGRLGLPDAGRAGRADWARASEGGGRGKDWAGGVLGPGQCGFWAGSLSISFLFYFLKQTNMFEFIYKLEFKPHSLN